MDSKTLYMDGNGRMTCEALACAGMTAHFSGMTRDLNGAPMACVTPDDARDFETATGQWPACE